MKKYSFVGSDERTNYLRKMFLEEGYEITDILKSDIVVTSIPFSKNDKTLNSEDLSVEDFIRLTKNKIVITGSIKEYIKAKFDKSTKIIDIMKCDELAIKNAVPTAEGAIFTAMKNSKTTITNSKCLVLGFGKIGKNLALKLKGMDANVTCQARKEIDFSTIESLGMKYLDISKLQEKISEYEYIFNTIPYLILDSKVLKNVSKDSIIVDLASVPGGVDFEFARKNNLNVEWSLGLPSKIAPKSAAKYLKEQIEKLDL